MKKKKDLELEIIELRGRLTDLEEEHRQLDDLFGPDPVALLIEIHEELNPGNGETALDRVNEIVAEAAEVEELRAQNSELEGQVQDLDAALTAAKQDREALLKRLGLTDFQWNMQGGNCYADVGD